jgi:arsenite-transporting ATPase
VESLHHLQIPLGGFLINRLVPSAENPATQDRYVEQQTVLGQFQTIAPHLPILTVPLQSSDPVGGEALDRLFTQITPLVGAVTIPKTTAPPIFPTKIPPGFPDFVAEGRRLILVGGKGGVGKTTVAAAIALGMAQRHPQQSIRVISIDPAHSLGDAFGQPLGHEATIIQRSSLVTSPSSLVTSPSSSDPESQATTDEGQETKDEQQRTKDKGQGTEENLTAQEIDADRVLEKFRDDYLWELAEMMSGDTGDSNLSLAYGPEAWRTIVAQALPGIDEMLSLVTVMELLETQEQDLIILDTAPTGHLLRFLEMPTAMGDWLAWIFKLWIKYQDVLGRTELMGRLRTLRQRVMQAQKKLKDPQHTEFIGVLQAQAAIVAEAERLSQSLTTMGVYQHYLVHNRYEPEQTIAADTFPGLTIVRLPSLPRSVPPLVRVTAAADLLF